VPIVTSRAGDPLAAAAFQALTRWTPGLSGARWLAKGALEVKHKLATPRPRIFRAGQQGLATSSVPVSWAAKRVLGSLGQDAAAGVG
jgi:hypothetical protein